MTQADKYIDWLLEITSLPTASGREWRVRRWVEQYAAKNKSVRVQTDRFGNMTLSRKGVRGTGAPVYFTAHMDHPSFVVRKVTGKRQVIAEFRGGVSREFFAGTKVALYHEDTPAQCGVVKSFVNPKQAGTDLGLGTDDSDKFLDVHFSRDVTAEVGDVLMWDVGKSRIKAGKLHAPACDDLAGLAAAMAAFDALGPKSSVRVLLTRAEEIGFIGAIAACKAKSIPKNARLICLENSKSYAESPIGGGPIVRVGDYTSTFDPDLTYQISQIAVAIAKVDKSFTWQRKLMPGGTCEASAFQTYGHVSTCVCLPLGNYHNMSDKPGKIGAEFVSVSDYQGLIRLLVESAKSLGSRGRAPALRARLDKLFDDRKGVLAE